MNRIISFLIVVTFISVALSGCFRKASNNIGDLAREVDSANSVVKGNTEFAFNIFREINKEETEKGDSIKSIFISPLSISMALSMAYNGAAGETKEAMEKALNYQGIGIKDLNESYKNLVKYLEKPDDKVELSINNSIWIRQGEKIKDDFIKINKATFNAHIEQLDFSKDTAAEKINKWIDEATKGKIDNVITPPIPAETIMYLINAVYFKGEWTISFDESRTYDTLFNQCNGNFTKVKMMTRKDRTEYTETKEYKAVRLPYGNGKISMYCILPMVSTGIDDLINGLNADKWDEIREGMQEVEELQLDIPRFNVEYGVKSLNDSLIRLGMGVAFGTKADFTGIRDDTYISGAKVNTAISNVLHKAVIEVNEAGSEAAGVTVVEMSDGAAPDEKKSHSFKADRPFLFIISDDETGSILFMGKFMG